MERRRINCKENIQYCMLILNLCCIYHPRRCGEKIPVKKSPPSSSLIVSQEEMDNESASDHDTDSDGDVQDSSSDKIEKSKTRVCLCKLRADYDRCVDVNNDFFHDYCLKDYIRPLRKFEIPRVSVRFPKNGTVPTLEESFGDSNPAHGVP